MQKNIKTIAELFSLEYGKALSGGQRLKGEYPVFGSNGIVGYHSEYLVEGPGVIVGRKGSIGLANWVDNNFWPIDTAYYVRLKNNNIDLKWLFYKIASMHLNKLNMATGVPGLNRDMVYNLQINVPSINEQRRIVKILATFDQRLDGLKNQEEKIEKIKMKFVKELLSEQ